jgi:predicted Fe-S protein YdhL (DUF1289 family)
MSTLILRTGVSDKLESPCVKVCQLDHAQGVCVGCLRTLNEIAGWGQMSGDERRRIMADLPKRQASKVAGGVI